MILTGVPHTCLLMVTVESRVLAVPEMSRECPRDTSHWGV
jgi:hypothetical protein